MVSNQNVKGRYEIWHRNAPRYPKEKMRYYFYYPLENKIFVARNAEFFENSLWYKKRVGVMDFSNRVGVTKDLN
ncbi:hypothetical protein Tco_0728419 [Tanacetum coccineum]|uniref:Uncharacterized protein n=1 Tax=Tanacetum coccineum TaxID=301880 RepID=A0ABQ4YL32_9ASTR